MNKIDITIELDSWDIAKIRNAMNLAYEIADKHKSDYVNVFENVAGHRCGEILYHTVIKPFDHKVAAQLKANE